MQAESSSFRVPRRGVLAAAFLAAAAWAAAAAAVGGGYWPAVGPSRITLKRSGLPPIEAAENLRFSFAGASSDLSGTAEVLAYDSLGQDVLAQFPASWTTGSGAAFRMDLLNEEFAEFLESRIEAAAGMPVSLTLESALAKGKLPKSGEEIRVVATATGEASLGDGPPRRFKVKMRLR